MSVVTSVTVMFSILEDKERDGTYSVIQRINEHLNAARHGSLREISDHAGGHKYPEICLAMGGFNYLETPEFIAMFQEIEWEFPEDVVLIIRQQDGHPEIHRPVKS